MKIKVFDTELKCFVDISGYKRAVLLTSDGYEMSTGYDGFDKPTFGINDSEGYPIMTEKEFSNYQSRFKYLHFSGKKDKNGTEIYEGDAYKIGEEIGYVDFQNGSFIWTGNGYPVSHKNIEFIEILGNIWSNPELLEAAN